MNAKFKKTLLQIQGLERERQAQSILMAERKKEGEDKLKGESAAQEKEALQQEKKDQETRLGKVLLEKKLITRASLKRALKFQKKYEGNLLRFLFINRDINENQLAERFSVEVPYLPLGTYEILDKTIELLPSALVEKYWVLPVDKLGSHIIVVMVDPFDTEAIKEIEELTNCTVQVYLGLFSEIAEKIQHFYKVNIRGLDAEGSLVSPLFIEEEAYKGRERRRAVRFKTGLALRIAEDEHLTASTAENISWDGLSFELDHELPIYSMLTIELSMPKSEDEEANQVPVAAVAQVTRATALENNKFMIGVKLLKMPKEDLGVIIKDAMQEQSKREAEAPDMAKLPPGLEDLF